MLLVRAPARRRLLPCRGLVAAGLGRTAETQPARQQLGRSSCRSSSSSADGQWSPHALGSPDVGAWEVDLSSGVGARGVLQLAGADAPKLLQGLVTNDVLHLAVSEPGEGAAMAAAFLTNKGRIITDAIISVARGAQAAPHGGADKLLVDLPLALKDAVLRHVRLFKLRAKVTITDLTPSTRVRVVLGPGAADAARRAYGPTALSLAADPRFPQDQGQGHPLHLGVRAIVPADDQASSSASASPLPLAPPEAYEALRFLNGVPEGPDGLVERLPSECNVDLLRGVNFAKGCYLGQELTARTQFKGVVRKRLLPFFLLPKTGQSPALAGATGAVPSLRDLLPSPDASPLLAPLLRVGALGGGEQQEGLEEVKPGAEVVPLDGDDGAGAGNKKALGTVVASAWPRANVGLALLRLEPVLGAASAVTTTGLRLATADGGVPLAVFTPLWWPPGLDLATGKVPS